MTCFMTLVFVGSLLYGLLVDMWGGSHWVQTLFLMRLRYGVNVFKVSDVAVDEP